MVSIKKNSLKALNGFTSGISQSKQHRRLIKVYVDGFEDNDFIVKTVVLKEKMSKAFHFKIEMYSETQHQLDSPVMLGVKALVVLAEDGEEPRYFHGHISSFISPQRGTQLNRTQYQMILSPWLSLYEQVTDCRIFQNASVVDVIGQLFKDISSANCDLSAVTQTHFKREYWVQYNETLVNFFNRICQAEGIGYYYVHSKTGHTLHLIDDIYRFKSLQGQNPLLIQPSTSAHSQLTSWSMTKNFVVSTTSQTSYNAITPSVIPSATAKSQGEIKTSPIAEALETYSYSEYFNSTLEGQTVTTRANQKNYARFAVWRGAGDYMHLMPGCNFRVEHVPASLELDDTNIDFTLLETTLKVDQKKHQVSVNFTAAPLGVLVTPEGHASVIAGLQTAVVTGNAKIGTPYTVDSEKLGRVKVQFHWDRQGQQDANTTCWLRVMNPLAGPQYGAQFTPRIGQEVVVAFENGNPDYPFILGALYNGRHTPPFVQDQGFRSGFRTASIETGKNESNASSYNEFSFYDKKGKEEVYLRAEKDFNSLVQGNREQHVMHNDSHTIDQNLTMNVGENVTIKAGSSITLEAASAVNIKVGGSTIEIKTSSITINGTEVNIGSLVNLG